MPLVTRNAELRDSVHHLLHLLSGDQPRAFELSGRAGMARAPQKILVVEALPDVIPAAIAGVPVDHPVWRGELVGRMGETADQHHWRAGRPGEPGEAAGEADKKFRVAQPSRPLGQRPVTGLILRAVRNVRPDDARAIYGALVDTDHAVAAGLQKGDHLTPAIGIVPGLAVGRALYADADIGFGDR